MKGVREKDALSVMWNAGTKNLEFIENGKRNLIWFAMFYVGGGKFASWEESRGLYYSHAKIIRRGGWKQRRI